MIWNNSSAHSLKEIKIFFSDVDGTLTDGFTYYSEKGEELKRFNHKDGAGAKMLKDYGLKFGIITTENSLIVQRRAEKLKADFCFIGIEDKVRTIQELLTTLSLSFSDVAYIGDDLNDLGLLKKAGVSFAVSDAVDLIKNDADFVCTNKGGYGAFREAVDFILAYKNSHV